MSNPGPWSLSSLAAASAPNSESAEEEADSPTPTPLQLSHKTLLRWKRELAQRGVLKCPKCRKEKSKDIQAYVVHLATCTCSAPSQNTKPSPNDKKRIKIEPKSEPKEPKDTTDAS